jgi:hypothetical protein
MKKILLIIFALLIICDISYAQKRKNRHKAYFGHRYYQRSKSSYDKYMRSIHEITLGFGANNFLGELGGANRIGSPKFNLRDFDVPSIMPVMNIGYRYQFHRDWAVRADLNAALLGGNDKFTLEPFRHNRNLNFRAPLIELSGRIEYLVDWTKKGQRYLRNVAGYRGYAISLYFFTGVSGFWFDPYGNSGNGWVRLKPLSTEGQGIIPGRTAYSNLQFGVPGGVGLRYVPGMNSKFGIGIEYSVRWTFTDYMDDASTTYVDNQALRQYKGDLAAQMANPAIDGFGAPLYRSTFPGQQRGDPRDNDTFMFVLISMYYKIEKGNAPIFKKKNTPKYKINTYCPTFKQ